MIPDSLSNLPLLLRFLSLHILTASDWSRTSLLFCRFLERPNLPRIPRGGVPDEAVDFLSLNVELATASDFPTPANLDSLEACDSAAGDFLPNIRLLIRAPLLVPARLLCPSDDCPESTELFFLFLPRILPKDDLARAVGRLGLDADWPPAADVGSFLLLITLPMDNLVRVVGRLKPAVELSLAADAGSLLLLITLPIDDLARLAGRLEPVELSLATNAGSFLLPTTLPICNVLPVSLFVPTLLAVDFP